MTVADKYRYWLLDSNRGLMILAFVFCAGLFFYQLGGIPLLSPDEGRNAEVAREMSLAHAWLVPTYNGLTYLDKPAFYFKTVALFFSLLGESEITARLSSVSFGFLGLIAVFLFSRRVYGQATAIFALLIVATTPLFLAFSRIVIFDIALAFFVCSAIFACYLAEEEPERYRNHWYLVAVIAVGIATLIKGPVGFILPTLVITVFNATEGRLSAMKRVFAPHQWLVFFIIVLPWFVGLCWQHPDFAYYGIMKESLARFTTPQFHRTQPFYFYGLIIATTFLPWSIFLPEAIYLAWLKRQKLARADKLLIIWAIVVVVFFSISKSKLSGYILTAIVALGMLTARLFATALIEDNYKVLQLLRRSNLGLLLLTISLTALFGILTAYPDIIAGHLTTEKQKIYALYVPSFLPLALSFAAVAVMSILACWQKNSWLIFFSFISFPVLIVTANFNLLSTYGELHSARSLATKLPTDLSADTELACFKCLPNGLPFYTKRLITVISSEGNELTSNYVLYTLKSAQPWPQGIVPLTQFQSWLLSRKQPVFLLAPKNELPELKNMIKQELQFYALDNNYWGILIPPLAKNN